ERLAIRRQHGAPVLGDRVGQGADVVGRLADGELAGRELGGTERDSTALAAGPARLPFAWHGRTIDRLRPEERRGSPASAPRRRTFVRARARRSPPWGGCRGTQGSRGARAASTRSCDP